MPSRSDETWRWQLGCCFATFVEIYLKRGNVWINILRLTDAGLCKMAKFAPTITDNHNMIMRTVKLFVI